MFIWVLWGTILLIPAAFTVMSIAVPVVFAAGWFWSGDVLLGFLNHFCHQMPSRSFRLWGYPFGLCIRCMAIYSTFAFVWIHSAFRISKLSAIQIPFAIGLTFPMFIDAGLQLAGIWNGSNWVRGMTGVLFGVGSSLLIWTGVLSIAFRRDQMLLARTGWVFHGLDTFKIKN